MGNLPDNLLDFRYQLVDEYRAYQKKQIEEGNRDYADYATWLEYRIWVMLTAKSRANE